MDADRRPETPHGSARAPSPGGVQGPGIARGRAPARRRAAHRQRGVALVVALILLVVISLVGLAAIGGSTLENKIAASQYDRQLAFQNAEAALRVAQAQIAAHPHGYARKCRASGVVCPANPFKDADLGKGKIVTVNPDRFQAGARAAGQPQYVIEDMGQWPNWKVGLGCENKLRERNAPPCPWVDYYRITARSGDPAKVGERAIVTLQAIVKQG